MAVRLCRGQFFSLLGTLVGWIYGFYNAEGHYFQISLVAVGGHVLQTIAELVMY